MLKAASPVLGNPFNYWRTVMLTFEQFRYAFANTMSEAAAREVYERHVIPGPGRPIFQAAFANFVPSAATTVNRRNRSRAPLLLIAGSEDHLVPAVLNRTNHQKYAGSGAVTDYQEFAGRSHLLIAQEGWQEVAEFALNWATAKAASRLRPGRPGRSGRTIPARRCSAREGNEREGMAQPADDPHGNAEPLAASTHADPERIDLEARRGTGGARAIARPLRAF